MLIEHLFVGELLRCAWRQGAFIEVLKPQVDDAGYDLLLESNGIARHLQLKASFHGSKTARQNIHLELGAKPSGCIVWILVDAKMLALGPFLWFGGTPGEKLPSLSMFKVAKHSKADMTGRKAERSMVRVVPKLKFEELSGIEELLARLFGRADLAIR